MMLVFNYKFYENDLLLDFLKIISHSYIISEFQAKANVIQNEEEMAMECTNESNQMFTFH